MNPVRSRSAASLRYPRLYRGWWVVGTGFLSQMLTVGATGWVFSVLIRPMEEGLGWSRVQVVGVLTLSTVLGGLSAVRLGPLVDHHGARLLMTGSALLGGLCLMLVGAVQSSWQYYACWAGFGLALPGLLTVGPTAAIANWFVRRRSLAFTFYTFGSAAAGILLAPLMARIAAGVSWRFAWVLLGLLLWCVAPLAWISIRRRPEELGLHPDGDPPAAPDSAALLAARPMAPEEAAWTVGEALRTRAFWMVTAAFMFTSLPASSIFVHMSPYVASKGFSAAAGATALSIYGIATLCGRGVWGVTIGRLGIHRALIAFGFTYALAIAAFLVPSTLTGLYAMIVFLGFSIAGAQQLQAQTYPDYFGRRIVGSLLGYSGIMLILSRASAPLFAAYVYDATGSYLFAFSVFAAACVLAGSIFLLAAPPRRAPECVDEASARLVRKPLTER